MSSVTKPYANVSLKQAVEIVKAIGDTATCMFSGEMGIGKSSMLKTLRQEFGDKYHYCYVDMTIKDVGDFMIPKVVDVDGVEVTRFAPNEEFGFHLSKPVVVMFDELGKASKAVLNAALRPILEHAMGTYTWPEGSIVFATTNLALEGLGDNLPPHARNRMVQMKIRKPTAMEWVEDFALKSQVHPIVIGAAIEFPAMFESFENVEEPNSNHYIFHPKSPRTAFVTPRSLEKASSILKRADEHELSDEVVVHALIGAIGEAAAMDLLTLRKLDEQLPSYERIINDPEDCKLPKAGAASCMVIAKIAMRVTREEMDDVIKYVRRMPAEVQALWMRTMMRGDKKTIAATHRGFTELASEKMFLFS